ncbi:alpha/beta fold hydrolase [Embleya scabrispora]|uniref:alpha/beta fold hydrolase n=1 Tax=Embleya scabrispora TaxID=159449 RepID=UPI0003787622|nr:alpha/beta hydrolase [Embleya scabrispora]MYS83904.1 alpha/beta fold hydrolase [Streptomyces sp. SID5474]
MTNTIVTSDVTVGEHTLRVNRAGQGNAETILFLHGSGPGATGMSNFAGTIEALSDTYDCLVVDQVGWGDSSHPEHTPPGSRLRQNVAACLGLLDELGLERVHLVGNSLGGALALHLLVRAPERFGKAVLMGAAGAGNMTTPPPAMMRLITFYDDPTARSMAELISFMLHDPTLFGDRLGAIAEERLAVAIRPEVERSHRQTFTMAPGAGPGLPEIALKRITNDVLLVHGREDVIVPPDGSEWFARRIPNARLYLVPHCGHWAQIEQADRFQAVTRAFLAGRL